VTHRTEANPPTRIEKATMDTVTKLSQDISVSYHTNRVQEQHGTTEPEFRRILALYFHDKSIADWCRDLGIQDATDPADHAQRR
jgi:hypothetical protein